MAVAGSRYSCQVLVFRGTRQVSAPTVRRCGEPPRKRHRPRRLVGPVPGRYHGRTVLWVACLPFAGMRFRPRQPSLAVRMPAEQPPQDHATLSVGGYSMPCLAIAIVLALLVLVVLILHQRHHGRLTFKWWAVPVLVAFAAASFPQSIITTLYFVIQSKFMAPYELALWITDDWREYGRYAAFIWVLGFPLVILLKGIVFTTRADAVRSIAVAILIMLPLTVIDSSLFWAANRAEKTERISSVSPDGQSRVTAIGTEGAKHSIVTNILCEDNVPHPWLARPLAAVPSSHLMSGDVKGRHRQ